MADDLGVSNHLTERDGVWQYVRRVPTDVREAFPLSRIQTSLRTRNQRQAREKAIALDRLWEHRFAEARERRGLATSVECGPSPTDTSDWTWPDWAALAAWFGATLAEEDWRLRLNDAEGRALGHVPDLAGLPWRGGEFVVEHIARGRLLQGLTVTAYADQRIAFVQSYVRRLGVTLSKTSPHHVRFMAACLTAELAYLDLFQLCESRQGGIGNPHPDTIVGPWRRAKTSEAVVLPSPPDPVAVASAGKTLEHCLLKWIANREASRKSVRPEHLREARFTISAFEKQAGVSDIGGIRRRDVLAFRDQLSTSTDYAVQTVNKKVGFITTLMGTALNAGWIETSLGEKILLAVPEDEDRREPYGDSHLRTIFSHPIFTAGLRETRAKAGCELQFWLPLISCLHGMISSEIIQLGPDTVSAHPDAPDVLCFNVTSAGDRRTKTFARRRWVPVRRELIELGLLRVVDAARRANRPFLWSAMDEQDGNVTRVSGYFSSFWADLSRKQFKITEDDLSLYSFRHSFQDRLGRTGYGEDMKKALMGHAESGMTGRYGTKKGPRSVNIGELNTVIQSLDWPFLKGIVGPR